MRKRKRLAAVLLAGVMCISLAACGKTAEDEESSLSVCVGTYPHTLDPIYAESPGDQTILAHLYENLMRIAVDEAGNEQLVPGMAKTVEKEEKLDGTVSYTFRLRGAKWSDGRDVKAEDFVYAWRRLADPTLDSPYAGLLSVVCGYEEARESGDMSLLQVSAKNDSTLIVTLDGDYGWFLPQACTATATMPLREDVVQELEALGIEAEDELGRRRLWWEEVTWLVANGPYRAAPAGEENCLKLVANERYYEDHETGPARLMFRFADTAETAQTLYHNGEVEVMWPLTQARLGELAADETWVGQPELETYAVLFNTETEPFGDDMIRKAMGMVIDRNAIADLAGSTASPAEGLVPAGVPENEDGDFRTGGGAVLDNDPANYMTRCNEAKTILSNAGYESSAVLQGLEYLYVDEGSNGAVAAALCRQWQTRLNIAVAPRAVTETELWEALRSGSYAIAGVVLESDINDAEGFLADWTSSSADNVVFYQNSAYDTLLSVVAVAEDGTARMGCLHDAETLLLNDYVVMPLFTEQTGWEAREDLTGVYRDPRGWFSFAAAQVVVEK
ncbi:MAG: peptide ABC transporter substrate-binding protein [Ruminococcaceae bacterium]|nr:peptide ABC transporter substrate-binding protein [Oscillospiraceae bacterium]